MQQSHHDTVRAAGHRHHLARPVHGAAERGLSRPAAGDPLTLYITEKGDESRAASLILMPQVNVASREFRLVMAGSSMVMPRSAAPVRQAAVWEQSQPFEVTLTEFLAGLAAGAVPQGYDLAAAVDLLATPRCAAPFRIDFAPGQLLTGGQLEAWVGTVHHVGSSQRSSSCSQATDDAFIIPSAHQCPTNVRTVLKMAG